MKDSFGFFDGDNYWDISIDNGQLMEAKNDETGDIYTPSALEASMAPDAWQQLQEELSVRP